jgi:hypothetical protein
MQGTDGSNEMVVTGFKQGGNEGDYYNYNEYAKQHQIPTIQRPYVGDLKADTVQPTTPIAVGTPCATIDIGAMAKQAISGVQNDVNNLYVSQVICMQNPLCPADSGGVCFMPANSVTITYNLPVVDNTALVINPKVISHVDCPPGMAMVDAITDGTGENDTPKGENDQCCGILCSGHKHVNYDGYDGTKYDYLSSSGSNTEKFRNGIRMGIVHKSEWCDTQCFCGIIGGFDHKKFQPQVKSITCSNDINRTPIEVWDN